MHLRFVCPMTETGAAHRDQLIAPPPVESGGGEGAPAGGAAAFPSGGDGPPSGYDTLWDARRALWRSARGGEVVGYAAGDPRLLREEDEAVPMDCMSAASEEEVYIDFKAATETTVRAHPLQRPLCLKDVVDLLMELFPPEEGMAFDDSAS